MTIGAEAWLTLLAAALYLYDSAQLLPSNQVILVETGRSRWRAAFGSIRWKLLGKEPMIPNPLLPGRRMTRLIWSHEAGLVAKPGALPPQMPEVSRWLPVIVYTELVLIFVWLPTLLFLYPVQILLALVAVAIYTCSIAGVFVARPQCLRDGMSSAAFWKMGFECIVCPPFSVNLVRKVSLASPIQLTLDVAAASLLSAEDIEQLRSEMRARVQEEIDAEPETSPRAIALRSAHDALTPKDAE